MPTIAELEREVMKLPDDQRVALIHRILETSDSTEGEDVAVLWSDEIVRRIELLDKGLTQRIPASDVFRELDQRWA
ncbi:addiction module protein [Persicirhabdus sediminis]|uniref:Addiction module protein n=1 Tax=Persicirhabdus sediminis TaxID=454144 RepID=A0A8J7SJ89_9BACT|nr:addiction module protein [Persicirhabdus sediminis]